VIRKKSSTPHEPAACGEQAAAPTLPAWKAFVVQLSCETRAASGVFSGRVEHISSGRRARFGTGEELLAALRKLLNELGENETREQ
jgi:hypothetical protein